MRGDSLLVARDAASLYYEISTCRRHRIGMTSPLLHLRRALNERYAIERELGHGGMATVYLAHDRRHQRTVAVKVVRPDLSEALRAERFLREIRTAAQLTHPHILAVHDSGEVDGLLYYVMPYVDGESLRARLQHEKQLPIDEALRITREIADALSYAHSRGVVHRDIKPENILLAGSHALVADFGIAALIDQGASFDKLTGTGVMLGTPAYMSPEQVSGDGELDGRSDIFSLGCVLYEMLAGEPPFTGSSVQTVLAKRFASPPQSIRNTRATVPLAVDHAVSRALAVVPADRFPTAAKFAEALTVSGVAALSDAPAAHAIGAAHVASPRTRWGLRARALVVAGVAAFLTLAFWWRTSPPFRTSSIPSASPTVVAVLPFTVHGGGQLAYLGDGMVNLLSTKLDGAGELRSADPRAVLAVARAGREVFDPMHASALAERLGAGLFVLGDVVEAGGKVHLSAALYEVKGSGTTAPSASVEGSAADVLALVDQLTTQLLSRRGKGLSTPVGSISSVTTSSLPALKAYLEGESLFRGGQFASAVEAFQRAVTLDTAFALAYYRLSVAAEWNGEPERTLRAAEQAVVYGERLSEHDRRLLDAFLAFRHGAAVEAERLYRAILGTYPHDLEGWMQLAEVQFHYGPMTSGRSISESREAFERVLALEPEHIGALFHLARVAVVEGQHAELDSLVQRANRLGVEGDRALEMLALRAFTLRDTAAQERVIAGLRRGSDWTVFTSTSNVTVFVEQSAGGERLAALLTAPSRSPRVRATGHIVLAQQQLVHGRWSAAKVQLARAKELDAQLGIAYLALLSGLPWISVPADELKAILEALGGWDSTVVDVGAGTDIFGMGGARPHIRLYLRGVLNARLGDEAAVLRSATALERLGGPADVMALARDLAHTIRAQSIVSQGRPHDALTEHERGTMRTWYAAGLTSAFFSRGYDRYVRAELLRTGGRYEEALRWYSTFSNTSLFDLVHVAPAHLQSATIYEQIGQPAKAIEHYERFIDLWKTCDPELQPMVADARARLSRLRKSP
ncbi:MAG: protein kinase domain-containing protein [Gemmatimonadaceae bacterium]